MSQLKKGAILSYANIGLTNVVGLLLTPYIIKSLGDSEYGLYTLLGSIIGYLSILDLGLNNAIIRYVSKYRAEGDAKGEENFLAITFLIYGVISLIIIGIGSVIYFQLSEIFKDSLTSYQIIEAKRMFIILIFNLAITLPGGAFTAVCNAHQQFVFPRVLKIIKYISRTLLVVSFLFYYPYALTLVWIDTILNVIVILITIFYVVKTLKLRVKMHQWSTPLVKDIFAYSVWIFLAAIVMRLQWNAGQMVLGVSENTIAVAVFGVGIMLGGYYGAFAGAINTLLLPKATQMSVNRNTSTDYNIAIQKVGRLNGYLLFLILSGFFVFGKEFISLWVGDTYEDSWEIAILVMLAMTLPLLQAFGNSILEAKKKNRFRSLVGFVTVSIAVSIAVLLVPNYHFRGVIYPLFIALVFNSLLMSWYYSKIFGFRLINFLSKVILRPVMVILPTSIIFLWIKSKWEINTWGNLCSQIILFGSIYFILIYLFVMNEKEKEILWRIKK
ncbi:oligosaccharide flippase family protein [Bizionia sp. KMM 8389]